MTNERAIMGGNNPPEPIDPIEAVIADYSDTIEEIANWTDGSPVETVEQMNAVDELLKDCKRYRSALEKAGKSRTDPFHKAWKSEVAAVKVYTDDADRMQTALVALVAPIKKRLADEAKARERAEWEAAQEAKRKAEELARAANAADLDAQRELDAARQAAIDAEKAAKAAKASAPKGMRTVHKYEITDHRALLNWIAKNRRDDLTAFIEEWAAKNHKGATADGLRTWSEKEAF